MAKFIYKAYLLDILDFEDLKLYHNCVRANMSRKKAHPRKTFRLSKFSDNECMLLFRFRRIDIELLVTTFRLEGVHKTHRRYKFTGVEGLCILLRHLSYPSRLTDLSRMFQRGPLSITIIFTWMVKHINNAFGHLLTNINAPWLTRATLFEMAKSIENAGAPLKYVWGFIDGTTRPICRPSVSQREYYSGHKRYHCIKFQSVMCPNGIISTLHGPFIGRRHDSFILQLTNLLSDLEDSQKMQLPNDKNFYLFGDTGYVNSKYLLTSFRNPHHGTPESEFNKSMSEFRVVVEWGYAKVISLFAFVDFKKNLKLLKQPVGNYYQVACLLTNCHTCLYGNQVSDYFQLNPPTLENYLRA